LPNAGKGLLIPAFLRLISVLASLTRDKHPQMKILSSFPHPHVIPKTISLSFIFGTLMKIFLIKSESLAYTVPLTAPQLPLLHKEIVKLILILIIVANN